MDINKLSMPEKIISASAIVLLIASFLPWFEASFAGYSETINGWSGDVGFFTGILPVLLGLVMLAHVVLSNFVENVKLPEAPWPLIHMVAGIAAGVLVVLRLLMGVDDGGAELLGISVDRAYGLFLATLAAIGLGVGGFLYNREHSGTGTATTM